MLEEATSIADRVKKQKTKRYISEALWSPFEKASNEQKAKAEAKFHAVVAVDVLVKQKIGLMDVIQIIAKEKISLTVLYGTGITK